MLDHPTDIREGEELDTNALKAYLLAHLPDAEGPLRVRQFPGGFSNLTYALTLGEREMVLRRPPFGANIKTGHDMHREYSVLRGLEGHYAKAPTPLLYCEEEGVIGAPFYVMQRVTGVILRGKHPELTSALMRGLSEAAVNALADLHTLDYAAMGLTELGKPQGYVERQIEGWARRYTRAQTEDIPALEAVIAWLREHMPADSGAALIHNDYKYDNMILNPDDLTDIIALLDWEMCTLGDPLMDLGTMLGYWIQPDDAPMLGAMFPLTTLEGNLTRSEVVQRYEAATGRTVEHPLYYYVYGLFKIAVIVQQIAARYQKGLTQDERFAALPYVVRACAEQAAAAIDSGEL